MLKWLVLWWIRHRRHRENIAGIVFYSIVSMAIKNITWVLPGLLTIVRRRAHCRHDRRFNAVLKPTVMASSTITLRIVVSAALSISAWGGSSTRIDGLRELGQLRDGYPQLLHNSSWVH